MGGSGEQIILRDEHRYIAHPHMAALASGEWLMVANRGPRRAVAMHPPQDPEYANILLRSSDEGRSWSTPCIVPAYGITGTECAGLTALPDGGVLLNQMRFRWYSATDIPDTDAKPLLATPDDLKRGLIASSELDTAHVASVAAEELMPWARGGCEASVYRSADGGRSFKQAAKLGTSPYSGGYGMRGAMVLPGGDIVLPLCDAPSYTQVFTLRSTDGGNSWGSAQPVASIPGLMFEEPAPLAFPDGELLMLLRENVSHSLFSVHSGDGGLSWSPPAPTGIAGYPAHIVDLRDGRIAAVAGQRTPPYGILAYVSHDRGRRFDLAAPVFVRTGLPGKDLGYPTAALRSDGSLYVAYYYRDSSGVTGLCASTAVF